MTDPHDELHLAAARIRDVAGKATPSPWHFDADPNETAIDSEDGHQVAETAYCGDHQDRCIPDATHIALWQPSVAELVAAVLQDEALYHYDARPAVVALARHLNGGTQ